MKNKITFIDFQKEYPSLETIDYLDYLDKFNIGEEYDIDSVLAKRKQDKLNDIFNSDI